MNNENLIPFNKRTESEQREIQSKGGVASGVVRRRKRTMKEAACLYMTLPVEDEQEYNRLLRSGVAPEDINQQMLVIAGVVKAGAKGNPKAVEILLRLLGEESLSVDGDLSLTIRIDYGEEDTA